MRLTLLLLAFIVFSCNQEKRSSEQDPLQEFKRIEAELQKENTLPENIDSAYSRLMGRAWEYTPTQQWYYNFQDFLDGYSENLESRFEKFVGAAIDSVESSAKFFKEKRNDPRYLIDGLASLAIGLKGMTKDSIKHEEIDAFVRSLPKNTNEIFTTSPPVALLTMIKYYRQKLRSIVVRVLDEYFAKIPE